MDTRRKEYTINYSYREDLLKVFEGVGAGKRYTKGQMIESGFTKLDYCYLITEGVVKQSFVDLEGKEKTILLLSKGDLFGEITLIQGDYDQVVTRAVTDVTACLISRDQFYETLDKAPGLYREVLTMITTKFRILMSQIHDEMFFETDEKLYYLLKRLSIQHGKPHGDGRIITLRLTHNELASMVGSTRSTVTKILSSFEKKSLIRKSGRLMVFLGEEFR